MCLAIPARVVAMDPAAETASVALGTVTKEVSLALVEDVAVGDYVLVHVGYALSRISPEEADRTLALMAEVARRGDESAEPPFDLDAGLAANPADRGGEGSA